jgi:putative tryptophan/tyrosine transport system substrate-binding protein
MIQRRAFVAGMAAAMMAPAFVSEAQSLLKRVGVLWTGSSEGPVARDVAFRQALRDSQYLEGRDVAIDNQYGNNRRARLEQLAVEMVRNNADILVTHGTPAALAAKKATKTTPIVMTAVGDPLGSGLVGSLARPGQNITGLAYVAADLSAKRLEILKDIVPGLSRALAIVHADDQTVPGDPYGRKATEDAARTLSVSVVITAVDSRADVSHAFTVARQHHAQAIIVLPSPVLATYGKNLIALAAEHRLPAIYQASGFVEAGGLMSYGPSNTEEARRAANYVDRIFKGAKPGDLPIEQPTTFQLAINAKTAKSLNLTIPPSLLLRADQVIE